MAAALRRTQRFTCVYDFGDNRERVLTVEDLVPPDPALPPIVCLAGANARPPEDVGGSYGYVDFLKILADPGHEEYADTLAWAGGAPPRLPRTPLRTIRTVAGRRRIRWPAVPSPSAASRPAAP